MQVKVWNDNIHPYSEDFRGQIIKIPAKSFILMDEGDAHLFRGSFAPIQVDGDGNPVAEGFKMIRIEKADDQSSAPRVEEPKKHICMSCKYEASSEKDLSEHIDSNHKSEIVVDAEAEREMARRAKSKTKKAG